MHHRSGIGDLIWHIHYFKMIAEQSRNGQVTVVAQPSTLTRAFIGKEPWVEDVIRNVAHIPSTEGVRLVRGSHIVVPKLYDHDRCYFFQGTDGRIIFAIPYENDFTLIGTTDADYKGDPGAVAITPAETDYLLKAASSYFNRDLTHADLCWAYSGVRALYDNGASSEQETTRDYVLALDRAPGQATLLSVFGGKITTYRRLAESALAKLAPFFPQAGGKWTAGVALPGGEGRPLFGMVLRNSVILIAQIGSSVQPSGPPGSSPVNNAGRLGHPYRPMKALRSASRPSRVTPSSSPITRVSRTGGRSAELRGRRVKSRPSLPGKASAPTNSLLKAGCCASAAAGASTTSACACCSSLNRRAWAPARWPSR
mgnify:CR=1 FL=1